MHAAGTCANVASPTKNELPAAHLSVREEFLAALVLSGANRDRYGALRNELANQYTFGNDLYPKTTDQCLTMMNRRVDNVLRQPRGPPCQPPAKQPIKNDDEALVFAQGTDKDTPPKGKPKTESSSKSLFFWVSLSRSQIQNGDVQELWPKGSCIIGMPSKEAS
jgi:hypothetical protein